MIFSDNKYVFWRLACDVLSSKTKLVNDSEIKYKRNSIRVPCYEHELLFMDFNTKKKALDHCKKLIEQGFYEKKIQFAHIDKFRKPKRLFKSKKLIEQGFYEKKIQFAHRRLFKNKNLRIEKWIKYKANNDVLPSKKMEKIGEFKYA